MYIISENCLQNNFLNCNNNLLKIIVIYLKVNNINIH